MKHAGRRLLYNMHKEEITIRKIQDNMETNINKR